MIIKTVSVSYQRKVNLGDFNSAQVESTAWVELEPEDNANLNEAMKDLWGMVKENVKAQLVPLMKNQSGAATEVKEMFLGLPSTKKE